MWYNIKMDNKAILIFGLLGLGLLFMLTQKPSGIVSYPAEGSVALPFKPNAQSINTQQYTNEETWDIDWSEDGLPKRVTIHRNAVQSELME